LREPSSLTESKKSALTAGGEIAHSPNFYCQAGKATFMVNPCGEMNACLNLPQPATRPLDVGFQTAWEEVQDYVDSAPPADPECQVCKDRSYCPRCPAWSALETGTLTKPVPYLCEIAHARKIRYAQLA
ncbi:MAG: hypothetical protein P1S60_19020, partial [Anaerolineae bacterium]|nr:hypothetical protein [Anaerolineae bacterium]